MSALAVARAQVAPLPPDTTQSQLIYFSSTSENTSRFVAKLGCELARIPLHAKDAPLLATRPYVLVVPTYGAPGRGLRAQAGDPLSERPAEQATDPWGYRCRQHKLRDNYCMAADIIAAKCNVPRLYRFELMGTPEDVARVHNGLDTFWTRLSQTQK
ncbi:protein NrdI [Arthrobacter sp. Hiyo4]|nr:protein NrdI [Arthrobacter sp. Hiyo4]